MCGEQTRQRTAHGEDGDVIEDALKNTLHCGMWSVFDEPNRTESEGIIFYATANGGREASIKIRHVDVVR